MPDERTIVDAFHRRYYDQPARTWQNTLYRGVRTAKCPLDLWVYQELVHRLRPALIVEAGTNRGGSAYFLADLCELQGAGEVVTVDVEELPERPLHPRITYLSGRSTDPAIVEAIRGRLPAEGHVMVLLDSDHSAANVAAELEAYAPMVTEGSYLVVEDTNVNGHPVAADFGPGPAEALAEFLTAHQEWEVDRDAEKYMLSFNPGGYLRRRASPST